MGGELVAATYEGIYYRAQIISRRDNQYKVIFVDYGNTEYVSQKDMKALASGLKSVIIDNLVIVIGKMIID